MLKIGKFAATVILGLLIHAVVTLPAILYFVAKRNPLTYFKNMSGALTTALSTASSAATLPMTIECVVNMNGTALYESIAAIFIAQMVGIHLGLGEQTLVFLTATLAAIGAAGIPEAGLVTMVIVLQAVGLPLEGIGMLLSIDWFLDRLRTSINVWGDSIGAAVVDRLEENYVEERETL